MFKHVLGEGAYMIPNFTDSCDIHQNNRKSRFDSRKSTLSLFISSWSLGLDPELIALV